VFPWKETRENHSFKITIDVSSSNHHQLEDDEVELGKSKRAKMTKTFGHDFLTYLLINKPQTYFEVISYPKTSYWNETINSEIKSIMNNYTWELVNLSPESKPLGHKWIFKRKMKTDDTNNKYKARLVVKSFRQ
jgi:hypothetical protein